LLHTLFVHTYRLAELANNDDAQGAFFFAFFGSVCDCARCSYMVRGAVFFRDEMAFVRCSICVLVCVFSIFVIFEAAFRCAGYVCSMLQYVAVCCNVCCSVLQYVAVSCSVLQRASLLLSRLILQQFAVCCNALQCVAVCCSVL